MVPVADPVAKQVVDVIGSDIAKRVAGAVIVIVFPS